MKTIQTIEMEIVSVAPEVEILADITIQVGKDLPVTEAVRIVDEIKRRFPRTAAKACRHGANGEWFGLTTDGGVSTFECRPGYLGKQEIMRFSKFAEELANRYGCFAKILIEQLMVRRLEISPKVSWRCLVLKHPKKRMNS